MAAELVLDTSAIVAIVSGEPGADSLLMRAQDRDERLVAAPSFVEAGIVLTKGKGLPRQTLSEFLERIGAELVPFDGQLAEAALDAYERFGKGNHPAGLNFGDCMSYALARVRGAPMLFTGKDFAQRDIEVV